MDPSPLRLAQVLDSLALAIELGLGVPAHTIHRTAVISARLGRGAGLGEEDEVAAFYLAILCYVGCTTTSHETSKAVDELGLGDLLVATDHDLERGRDVRRVHAEVGRALAVDPHAQLRLVELERRVRVDEAEVVATSVLAYAEARATFARRRRERLMTVAEAKAAVRQLDADWPRFVAIACDGELARAAGRLADERGIRGADAVHLASFEELRARCDDEPLRFSSADDELTRAARALG